MSENRLRLRAPDAVGRLGEPIELDESQQAVVDRRRGSGPLVVTGGPGTGKTTTLVEAVSARVLRDGLDPGSVLVLAPTRVAAASLRDRVTRRITGGGAGALLEPPARSAASYAFSLIRRQAVQAGQPTPRLISGPEQDLILADLLAGHAEGDGARPRWPASIEQALPLTGFRHELRDLFMRAMERGITPDELTRLARLHKRPIWRSAAVVMAEYLEVTALSTQGAYDPAAIVDHAAALLAGDTELLAAERARLRLVAVDDHQESSEAVARLLDQLCPPGTDLLLIGDPDSTTQSFRGAQAQLLGQAPDRYPQRGGDPAPVLTLTTNHRSGAQLNTVRQRVVSRVGALAPDPAGRRNADPVGPDLPGAVRTVLTRSVAAQSALIAAELRAAHLNEGVPWSQLAVIVRNSLQVSQVRRGLVQAGVPVGFSAAEVALRDEPAVRPLLAITATLLSPDDRLGDPDLVVGLLTSLTRLDAVGVRSLRRGLRNAERAAGGDRSSDDLLRAALAGEPLAETLDLSTIEPDLLQQVHHVASVLAAGREVLTERGATAERLLWAVWQATGFADVWQARALAGGRAGRRADRDLDAVVALFEAAARFADRLPGAGAMEFLTRLAATDLPEDSLAPASPTEEVVTVTTPQAVVGKEFDVVVVAGLQDGVWPNTRLRGSLLGSTVLVDLIAGRQVGIGHDDPVALRAARREVLHDELRMLQVAVTRARQRLLLVAVSNADTVPSSFLDLLDPLPDGAARAVQAAPPAVSLAGVVARLRTLLLDPSAPAATRRTAAEQLKRLADERVPGADPATWYGWAGLSEDAALAPAGPVRVSPSAIETFNDCALRWLLDRSGARPPAPPKTAIGTLIHDLAHEYPEAGVAQLHTALAEQWPSLGLPEGWVSSQLYSRAENMLTRLVRYRAGSENTPVATEADFRVRVGDALLTGRLDLLERTPDGDLVAVDLKTGRSIPSDKKAPRNAQLGAYQLAVQSGQFDHLAPGADSAGAQLVQLGSENQGVKVQSQPALSADPDPNWADMLVRSTAEGMVAAEFAATPNDSCRYCPVRSSCPAQAEGRQL